MPRIPASRAPRALLLFAYLGLALAATPRPAAAICCPFPCDDCALLSFGQMNFVRMDRVAGQVRLIPNIRIVGTAPDFSLVIPTPAVPTLAAAPKEIWTEASALTAPVNSSLSGDDGFLGCSSSDRALGTEANNLPTDRRDVEIISRQTVGAFNAIILTSEVPDALIRWLRDNGFDVTEDEARAFTPLVQRGWVFTAMKLDRSRPEGRMPVGGWNNGVDPVELAWASTSFEVPLDMLAINRGDTLPMAFFILDDHRTVLPGFTTSYANRISRSEKKAIDAGYPHLGPFLPANRFLTRLDRTYQRQDPMTGTLTLTNAPTDAEFRQVRGSTFGAFGLEWLFLLGVPLVRRRRLTDEVPIPPRAPSA